MNRPLSEILTSLIGISEDFVTRPATVMTRYGNGLAALAAEVRHADALPAEGVRTTRAALVMVIALEEFCAGDHSPGSPWLMLAGTTLPLLRVEAWLALRQEKEARGQS